MLSNINSTASARQSLVVSVTPNVSKKVSTAARASLMPLQEDEVMQWHKGVAQPG